MNSALSSTLLPPLARSHAARRSLFSVLRLPRLPRLHATELPTAPDRNANGQTDFNTSSDFGDFGDSSMVREARRREAKILLAVEHPAQRALLSDVLCRDGYSRLRASNSRREAVELARAWEPDLIVLGQPSAPRTSRAPVSERQALRDLLFGGVDGGIDRARAVLVVSDEPGDEAAIRALRLGARDVVRCPFNAQELCLRVRNLLEARLNEEDGHQKSRWLEDQLRERTLDLERTQDALKEAQAETIVRLALAAELHDPETGEHTRRVGLSASLLAQNLGLPEREVQMIQSAAPLHDIGKIAIPDALLLKPGPLSAEEWEEMKTHCRIGAQVLAGGADDLVQVAQRIALFHHEHWDGSGYPIGLCEEQIPLEARILAVADVFDALTHERPYKHAWAIDEALCEIQSQSGRHFDPQIVHAFCELPHAELV